MNELPQPTQTLGRRVFEVLFINRASIAVISVILLVMIGSLPNLGVIAGWAFLLIALLLGVRQGSFAEIGFRRPESWPRTVLLGLGLGFVIQLAYSVLVDPLLEHLTRNEIDVSMLDGMRGHFVNYVIMLAVGWVIGGFLEEMLFRGYILKRVKRVLGEGWVAVAVAVLLPAVAFGLAHSYQGPAGMLSTGSIGLILGAIFVWNRYNLWLPIMVHGFIDMVGITFIYLDIDRVLNRLLLN